MTGIGSARMEGGEVLIAGDSSTSDASILDDVDRARWSAFIASARVGGAIPVSFLMQDDFVVLEAFVPYVSPDSASSDPAICSDLNVGAFPIRIPIQIADGFPVPVSGRCRLPPFVNESLSASFLRDLVRQLYLHEIDEQFRLADRRPFAAHSDLDKDS